jgi:hypothetical protein
MVREPACYLTASTSEARRFYNFPSWPKCRWIRKDEAARTPVKGGWKTACGAYISEIFVGQLDKQERNGRPLIRQYAVRGVRPLSAHLPRSTKDVLAAAEWTRLDYEHLTLGRDTQSRRTSRQQFESGASLARAQFSRYDATSSSELSATLWRTNLYRCWGQLQAYPLNR